MPAPIALIGIPTLLFLLLALITRINSWRIAQHNPPRGRLVEVNGVGLHHVHMEASDGADLPPVVFIHGASANLNDQMEPLKPLLDGRAEMLFFDRPGHGWSGRSRGHDSQAGQAKLLAGLMDRLGVGPAILVAHSFGGSVAAAFALAYPERVKGLVFLSAATHPWPGGRTSWYYRLTTIPLIGWLFSETVANPAGTARLKRAVECVFAPNPVPPGYHRRAQIPLVLRPRAFRANAADVEGLFRFAEANAPRYHEITVPTVVISGDADTVVYEEIHSLGLARDIRGSELVWVRNLGHKPDWNAPDLVVAAIEKLGGYPRDLQAAALAVEERIAGDRFGVGCEATKATGELSAA
jgi:pimeloyl-ACP methyl ester carboxylesterase